MSKLYPLEKIIEFANQGNPEFQHRLARHHLARTKDYGEAKKWLELAADQGYAPALIDLGHSYFIGKYTEKDAAKGEKYFRLAIAQGDSKAMLQLGNIYWYGEYVPKNEEEALKLWRQSAELGNVAALVRLGMCYLYGNGLDQNYEEAFKCYLAADDKEMLGTCYLKGWGVDRNVEKTIELWESACEERTRYYAVMFLLAHLYGDGIEMEPDYKKALYWWDELAHNDSGEFLQDGAFAEAVYQIACCFYEGKGFKKNLKSALRYFKSTIDVFYDQEPDIYFHEFDPERHVVILRSYEKDEKCFISQEPDFIIHARKILIKHGQKSIINKTKKAAQLGDVKAAEILNEFGIEYIIPKQPEPVIPEVKQDPVVKAEPKREPPVPVFVGDLLYHKNFGEGVVCEVDDDRICVEFASVGKKKFLNPEAFNKGFLSDRLDTFGCKIK